MNNVGQGFGMIGAAILAGTTGIDRAAQVGRSRIKFAAQVPNEIP